MKKLFTCSFPFTASLWVGLLSLLLYSGSVRAQTFAKGADVGWLQQMEATGYVFYNDKGVAQDCFQILKDKGINSIRLRVFVNPSNDRASGHCSKDEVVAMSVRAKAMGFRIMIDFHYSDTWADPGNQVKPAAWANHSFAQLKTDVYDHTYDVMNALKDNGVIPEWVQVGNEIRGGMLRPDGSTSNYPQLAQLITSGYNAVKAVSPTSKVIVHLDKGNDGALYRGFFDNLRNNGAMYDVIGMSYYPYWLNQDYTASINDLSNNLKDMVTRYGKEVVVAEVGGDYTAVQNTYDMLVTVQNVVRAVPNSKGLGVFYWEPQGAKSWSGYQLSSWGDDGKPTRALDAFLHDGSPYTPPSSSPTLITNPGFEANQARTQTPTGWSTWSKTPAMAAAQYTETGGHSGNYRLTHYSASAYEVSIYQVKTGLPNGTYTLKAWVKNFGGQTTCQLYAKNFGGAEKNYNLPNVGDTWTQIQITDIQVTNGQCEIGLYTLGKAGNFCSIDDIGLYANQTITFPAISPKAVGDADADPGASASSGLGISYTSSNPEVATIVNGKIRFVGSGTSVITASQVGNETYNAAPAVTQTLTVGTASSPLPVNNPGFEANQLRTQTPSGWSTYSKTPAMAAAQYTEPGGHSGNYRLTHYSASAYEVSIYQVKTGLPNGTYTLKAWVKNFGGQTVCQLYAKTLGGAEKNVSLPNIGDTWTQIQITDVQVTDGQCEIGLYTVGNAGNFSSVDDIEFYANQTTTFSAFSPKTLGDVDFDPGATASSGLPVTYTSSNPAVATIVDGRIQIIGSGTSIILASQGGNSIYGAATPVSQTLTVGKQNQTITFPTLPEKKRDDPDFAIDATASSALPVSYSSSNPAVAVIADNKIHLTGVGTTVITASQVGNDTYDAATPVLQTLTVAAVAQAITFNPLPEKQVTDADFDAGATASSGLEASYTSSNADVATIVDGKIHIVSSGTSDITAAQAGNDTYSTAALVTQTLTVVKQAQSISFDPLPVKQMGDADFAPTATASSGLTVSYVSSNTAVATIIEDKIHLIGAGTTTITAMQTGNGRYNSAAAVSQSLLVSAQPQAITFNALPEKKIGDADFDAGAVASSGLLISYTSSNAAVATIVAGRIHIVGAGNSVITASQVGNDRYSAAAPVTQQLTVTLPASVKVKFQDGDNGQVANNNIKPNLTLVNEGTIAVPYSELTMRYWFTAENFAGINTWIDYAQLGNNKVKMKYVGAAQPRNGATGYVEYSFDGSAGNLVAGGNSGPIQSRFANGDWSNLAENDDYSYQRFTSYTYSDRITVYRTNSAGEPQLIWGTEPAIVAPLTKLKVYSENKNSNTAGNTISTYLKIDNEGNQPITYGDLSVRYWFTSEGTQNLNYWVDYAKLGTSNVTGQFVRNIGRTKADSYFELKVKPGVGTLYPASSTGNIQYRIAKSDWSAFNETNDYSYKPAAPLAENDRITVYYKGALVYGTEPTSGARSAAEETEALQVRILGNPVPGDQAEIEIRGADHQPVQLQLVTAAGLPVLNKQINCASSIERYALSLGKATGVYVLRVSTPSEFVVLKVIRQ